MIYKTNSAYTSKMMAEWYCGKSFVAEETNEAKCLNRKTGETNFRFWQDGTGYLTIQIG